MNNGIVIADAGPIFSLALIDKLHILDELFDTIRGFLKPFGRK